MPTILQVVLFICIFLETNALRDPHCGIPRNVIKELIVNGHGTLPGEWPWHTAIYHKKPGQRSGEYACGGTLISQQFILTAAHCVLTPSGYKIPTNRIFVRLGMHDLDELNPQSLQQHRVHDIHITGNYTRRGKRDDIALIEMTTLAHFNNFVQPACLNQVADLTGELGTSIGWGVTEDDEVSAVLKQAVMPVIDTFTCLRSNRLLFGQTLDAGIFCAGFQNGTTVCNGDSGGGLFFKRGGAWFVGGIVSFSAFRDTSGLCSTEGYAAFTNVFNFLQWIKNVTGLKYIGATEVGSKGPLQLNSTATELELPYGWALSRKFLELLPEDCGLSIVDRIPEGNATQLFAYPWMAQLRYKQSGEIRYLCDGTLFHKRFVLTSALCLVQDKRKGLTFVVLGEHSRFQATDCHIYRDSKGVEIDRHCAGPTEYFEVEWSVAHSDYEGNPKHLNNIGLVRLNRDVVMKDHIRPVCLPTTAELRSVELDSYVVVSWGTGDKYSNTQMEATGLWLSNSECRQAIEDLGKGIKVVDQHLCVRDQLMTPCISRNGTPLGAAGNHTDNRFVQFGIMTWTATSCGITSVPSIFTRVGSHMNWILTNIQA